MDTQRKRVEPTWPNMNRIKLEPLCNRGFDNPTLMGSLTNLRHCTQVGDTSLSFRETMSRYMFVHCCVKSSFFHRNLLNTASAILRFDHHGIRWNLDSCVLRLHDMEVLVDEFNWTKSKHVRLAACEFFSVVCRQTYRARLLESSS